MSLSAETFDKAIEEMLASPFGDKLAALRVLSREKALWQAQHQNDCWADGRRGESVAKIPGLTDTLTSLVRRFAACGVVRYADMDDLHRHASALRKRLKDLAPSVEIETIIGEGYEVVSGFDELYRLLRAGAKPTQKLPGFTTKQVDIMRLLASRGSAHVDQFICLQRHMSNIRAALKKAGFSKKITIETHGGEGLYTVSKGREILAALVAGEIAITPAPAAQPKAIAPSEPKKRAHRAKPQLSIVSNAA